jgi:siroheme synthase-like protein
MFLKLEGKRCLVVGAGKVGEPKIGGLLETGARIRVVSLWATPQVREWAEAGRIELELRAFTSEDLAGQFLIVVATSSNRLNQFIYREAEGRGLLCNVVDVPELCDFYYGSVVRRGDLQIAISTAGKSPSLAQKIRHQLERLFGEGYAHWVEQLGETRQLIRASDLNPETKRELLQCLASREAAEAAVARMRDPNARFEAAEAETVAVHSEGS